MIIMSMKKFVSVVLGVGVLLGASGCSAGPSTGAPISIVAASYPFEFVVERVVGDKAEVSTLVPPGVEAHDYELTPKQIAALNSADLVIYQSGMTAAIDDAVQASANESVLNTGDEVDLLPYAHEESHDDESHDEDDHDHDHGAYDPHIWLDPNNMVLVAEAVKQRMVEIDPTNASVYAENTESLVADLRELDADFTTGLKDCERTVFITSHAAFGYLANAYDLRQIAIAGITPESSPSPTRLADIQILAKDYGITTILTETLASPAFSETLARDLGIGTDVLDPLEGLSQDSRGDDYLEIMRSNLATLRLANGCEI